MKRVVSATEARIHFGEVMRDVADGGEETPTDWLARADRIRERIQRELNGRDLTPADEVIRAMREERDVQLRGIIRRESICEG